MEDRRQIAEGREQLGEFRIKNAEFRTVIWPQKGTKSIESLKSQSGKVF